MKQVGGFLPQTSLVQPARDLSGLSYGQHKIQAVELLWVETKSDPRAFQLGSTILLLLINFKTWSAYITDEDLAHTLGSSRKTVARQIKALQNTGL